MKKSLSQNNLNLLLQLIKRDYQARYQESFLGFLWTLLLPLLMLAIYVFVFSAVFKVKWGNLEQDQLAFASALFSGLIFYNYFAEVASAAPSLIIDKANLVKKVIFPLELIPLVDVLSAGIRFLASFIILLCFLFFTRSVDFYLFIHLPLIFIFYLLFLSGVSALLSALSVYLRDVKHFIGVLVSVLLFLSPIFYPISMVPETFQKIILFNPLSIFIECFRNVVLFAKAPELNEYIVISSFSIFFFYIGWRFFLKTKKGFADVL